MHIFTIWCTLTDVNTGETTTKIYRSFSSPSKDFSCPSTALSSPPLGLDSKGPTCYHDNVNFYFLEFCTSGIILYAYFCACSLATGVMILNLYGRVLFCLFIYLLKYMLVFSSLGIL